MAEMNWQNYKLGHMSAIICIYMYLAQLAVYLLLLDISCYPFIVFHCFDPAGWVTGRASSL